MTPTRELRLPHGFDAVDDIVGLDAEGCVVIAFGTGSMMVLTPCCHAGGKAGIDSMTGVVCRAGHREVHHKHGSDGTEIAVARDDLDIVIEPPTPGAHATW